jgi:hypothetical protein
VLGRSFKSTHDELLTIEYYHQPPECFGFFAFFKRSPCLRTDDRSFSGSSPG